MTNLTTTGPERLLAIGDIHGCRNQLSTLLQKVAPTEKDQVVFLGDYVDRGPDSAGVINDLIEFVQAYPTTIFLRGNHEQMFTEYLDGHDPVMFLLNGGSKTLDSYQQSGQWPLPTSHSDFFASLHNCYETADFVFVHAGLRPGVPIAAQKDQDMLWIRQEFIESDYDWGKVVVYGHTPQMKPHSSENRLGLDTGCVYGRQLTCCDVLTRTFWQT